MQASPFRGGRLVAIFAGMNKTQLTPAMLRFAKPETAEKWLAAMETAGVANVRDAVSTAGMLAPQGIDLRHRP